MMDRLWPWAAVAVCVAAWWIWERLRERDFARERPYSINAPFPLSGIPDLIRQESGGELSIHDLKTRARAVWFESDKIQLSLYRMLVARATGRRVRAVGYIRARTPDGPDRLLEVPLYDEAQMVALYDRYMALLDGRETAKFSRSSALCALCGFHQKQCFPPAKKEPVKTGSGKTGKGASASNSGPRRR